MADCAIVFVSGKLDADEYISQVLAKCKQCLRRKKVIVDGAACHTARKSKEWCRDNGIDVVPNWPARSPNLNMVERVWAVLARRVSARWCTTVAELRISINTEFSSAVRDGTIAAIVRGWKNEVKKTLDRGGAEM